MRRGAWPRHDEKERSDTMADCEIKIESRDGATLSKRYTTLDEIREWAASETPSTDHYDFALTAYTPAGEIVYGSPDPPLPARTIFFPDGSWEEADDLGDFVRAVEGRIGG
jgi:hypothetical protein